MPEPDLDTLDDDLDEEDETPEPAPGPASFEAFVAERGLDHDELLQDESDRYDKLWNEWEAEDDRRTEDERKQKELAQAAERARNLPIRRQLEQADKRIAEIDAATASLPPGSPEWVELSNERNLLAFNAGQLETELPFVGMDDEALERHVDVLEIDADEKQAQWSQIVRDSQTPGISSPRQRQAEKIKNDAHAALTQARQALENRRAAAGFEQMKQVYVRGRVADAVEKFKSTHRFNLEQRLQEDLYANRISKLDAEIERRELEKRLEKPDTREIEAKARAEAEATMGAKLRGQILQQSTR